MTAVWIWLGAAASGVIVGIVDACLLRFFVRRILLDPDDNSAGSGARVWVFLVLSFGRLGVVLLPALLFLFFCAPWGSAVYLLVCGGAAVVAAMIMSRIKRKPSMQDRQT